MAHHGHVLEDAGIDDADVEDASDDATLEDAAGSEDAGVDASDPELSGAGGCGCEIPHTSSEDRGGLVSLLVLALAVVRRRARR